MSGLARLLYYEVRKIYNEISLKYLIPVVLYVHNWNSWIFETCKLYYRMMCVEWMYKKAIEIVW